MRHVDLGTGTLANRAHADRALESLGEGEKGRGLVLDFNENLATMSWLDGYLTPILRDGSVGSVIVFCRSDETREHIAATLRRRNLAVLSAASEAQFYAGRFEILGDITEEQRAAFDVLTSFGRLRVASVAELLGLSIEAAQQRLSDLLHKRLVDRDKAGRAYEYSVPSGSLTSTTAA